MADPVTAQFAEIISNMTFEKVRASVLEQIRWRVLDVLAVALTMNINPADGEPGQQAWGAVLSDAPQVDHNALRYLQVHPVLSALANGAMLDLQPHRPQAHGGAASLDAAIIPAAWAQVEACQGSGQLLMNALAAGYTATELLSGLERSNGNHEWDAGVSSGTVGAAAAVARARNLPAPAVLNAVGFAATQAAQLAGNATTASRVTAGPGFYRPSRDAADLPGPGRAAMDGVLCAQMAALGARCPNAMIDQLQAAVGTVTCLSVMTDAWSADTQRLAAKVKKEAIETFRKRVSAVISPSETQMFINVVQRLEHVAPGELMLHLISRIRSRLDS